MFIFVLEKTRQDLPNIRPFCKGSQTIWLYECVRACVRACMWVNTCARACVRVCVRACVRACVTWHEISCGVPRDVMKNPLARTCDMSFTCHAPCWFSQLKVSRNVVLVIISTKTDILRKTIIFIPRQKNIIAPIWRGRHREPAKAGLEWHATAPFRNAFDVHVADYSIVISTRTRFLWSHVCSRNYC